MENPANTSRLRTAGVPHYSACVRSTPRRRHDRARGPFPSFPAHDPVAPRAFFSRTNRPPPPPLTAVLSKTFPPRTSAYAPCRKSRRDLLRRCVRNDDNNNNNNNTNNIVLVLVRAGTRDRTRTRPGNNVTGWCAGLGCIRDFTCF